MVAPLKEEQLYNDQLISYLQDVLATPNMPLNAQIELKAAILALHRRDASTQELLVRVPHPSDSSSKTLEMWRVIMNEFYKRYPSIITNQKQFDEQEEKLQNFVNQIKPNMSFTP